MKSLRNARRFRLVAVLWLLVLAASGRPSRLVAEDGCPKDDRDCTFTEEIMDCLLEANDSFEDCIEDAAQADSWFWGTVSAMGCAAADIVNSSVCPFDGPIEFFLKF